ncbi:DUF2269 family protein [Conexibacter sp. SYSU D00693]|uniref:DUF2269 family protein n=1 Tax=Conexibacter sp. SYSU D00693 TaxID=2812560 RepID=UPI00196AE28C|nr:DUF2269 family protein [Conexibacter sp. SYSU D00693]
MPVAIMFYDVVKWIHVTAIVIAFGVVFVYPVVIPWVQRQHASAMPAIYGMQAQIGSKVIAPAATVALVAGVYMASDRDLWDQSWVTIPFLLLVVIMGLAGAVLTPTERKLAATSQRDLEAGGEPSAELRALEQRQRTVGGIASLLVLVALFFMVVKP